MMHRKQSLAVISAFLLFITLTLSIKPALTITWSSNTSPLYTPSYVYFDGYPSVAHTNDGRIWIVWSRTVNGYRALYYTTSPNMGYSWSTPQNLTNVPQAYENTKPSIIQAIDGSIWVVWARNTNSPPTPKPDFQLTASPDSLVIAQGSWEESTITVTSLYGFSEQVTLTVLNIPQGVSATPSPAQVTPPPDGTASSTLTISVGAAATPGNYDLTVRGTSGGIPPKYHDINIALQIVEMGALEYLIINHYDIRENTVTESSDGLDFDICYRTSSDNGITWSDIHDLTTDTVIDDLSPAILQLRNGTFFVFYKSDAAVDKEEIFYKKSSDGGTTWSEREQLTDNADLDTSPSATQTRDDKIWVAWQSETGNFPYYYDIYYAIYDGQWSSAQKLSTSTSYDETCPALLETVDGLVRIFWSSNSGTSGADDDIYCSYTSNEGSSWSSPVRLTPLGDNDEWSSAAQIRDNSILVAWASDVSGNYEIVYKTSIVGDLIAPVGVDIYDLAFMRTAYGTRQEDPEWAEYQVADITGPENPINSRKYPPDGIVSVYDLFALGKNYGKS